MRLSDLHPTYNLVTDIYLSPIVQHLSNPFVLHVLMQCKDPITSEPDFFSPYDILSTTGSTLHPVVLRPVHLQCLHRLLFLWDGSIASRWPTVTPLMLCSLLEDILGVRNWLIDNVTRFHCSTGRPHKVTSEISSVIYLQMVQTIIETYMTYRTQKQPWTATFRLLAADSNASIVTVIKDTPLGCLFRQKVEEYRPTFRSINKHYPIVHLS